jgi:hypothetical protein
VVKELDCAILRALETDFAPALHKHKHKLLI